MERKLTPEMIDDLRRQGLSLAQIGEIFDTPAKTVSWLKRHGEITPWRSAIELARDYLPLGWENMDRKYQEGVPFQRIRNHLEFMISGGVGMSASKLSRLRSWYGMIVKYGVVVEFDPTIVGRIGLHNGGWDYRTKTFQDGDLLLRRNEYTEINPSVEFIWRLPEKWPQE